MVAAAAGKWTSALVLTSLHVRLITPKTNHWNAQRRQMPKLLLRKLLLLHNTTATTAAATTNAAMSAVEFAMIAVLQVMVIRGEVRALHTKPALMLMTRVNGCRKHDGANIRIAAWYVRMFISKLFAIVARIAATHVMEFLGEVRAFPDKPALMSSTQSP